MQAATKALYQQKPSRNGKFTNSNGHHSGLAAILLRHCHDKTRHRVPPRMEHVSPARREQLQNVRNAAQVIAFLQHDTPERRAITRKLGLDETVFSSAVCRGLARKTLADLDSDQPGRMVGKWEDPPETKQDGKLPSWGLHTRRLCEVEEREVDWLWEQRFPLGKLSLVNGDPDLGKGWLILDIMARITTGQPLPDGSPNPFGGKPRDVLWASTEDEDEDTIKPRFRILGGDPTRFHSHLFVLARKPSKNGKDMEDEERCLNLEEDIPYIDRWLTRHPLCVLAALDPFEAFVGKINTHVSAEVRALLAPLTKIASKHRIAVFGNNHLNKAGINSAMYRGMGSIAFVAAARASWMVTKDLEKPERRLFTKIKCNLQTEDVGGLAFTISETNDRVISWEQGKVETTADEALGEADTSRAPALAEAKEWLKELLAEGPVLADEVWDRAKADGMCEKTVKAAKKALGIGTKKTGGTGAPWEWTLPAPKK